MKSKKQRFADTRKREYDGTFVPIYDDPEALFPIILERIENGESLLSICQQDGMPTHSTVHRWMDAAPEMKEQYYSARKAQAHYFADEVGGIVKQVLSGEIKPDAGRVAIQGRQWQAKVYNPNRYGDQKQIKVTDGVSMRKLLTEAGQRAKERLELVKSEERTK